MAQTERRVNSKRDREERYVIEGNAARQVRAIPQEEEVRERRGRAAERRLQTGMSRAYVLFLAAASAAAVVMGVRYVELRSSLTKVTREVATAESELNTLKTTNDAYYNEVLASVDLEEIKEKAMNELGMDYPKANQIYEFDTAGNSYIRQYQDVPQAD